jgi:hypothetical protein
MASANTTRGNSTKDRRSATQTFVTCHGETLGSVASASQLMTHPDVYQCGSFDESKAALKADSETIAIFFIDSPARHIAFALQDGHSPDEALHNWRTTTKEIQEIVTQNRARVKVIESSATDLSELFRQIGLSDVTVSTDPKPTPDPVLTLFAEEMIKQDADDAAMAALIQAGSLRHDESATLESLKQAIIQYQTSVTDLAGAKTAAHQQQEQEAAELIAQQAEQLRALEDAIQTQTALVLRSEEALIEVQTLATDNLLAQHSSDNGILEIAQQKMDHTKQGNLHLQTANARLLSQIENMQLELNQITAHRAELTSEIDQLREHISGIMSTRSARLMAPFRKLRASTLQRRSRND